MNVLPDTPYDRALDAESVHPGIQMFEKRISGMYLGEVLRHAIVGLVSSQRIHTIPAKLHEQYVIDSSFLSIAAGDETAELTVLRAQLKQHLEIDASKEMAEAVKILALAIGRRAARLAGVAIAGVIIKSGRLRSAGPPLIKGVSSSSIESMKDLEQGTSGNGLSKDSVNHQGFWFSLRRILLRTTSWLNSWHRRLFGISETKKIEHVEPEKIDVGVDGSLFEFYPNFEEIIRGVLREVEEIGVEGERRVQIGKAQDGSGVGAALAARAAGKAKELKSKASLP
jgi:hexokinase